MDRLAKQGILYRQAICQCPACVPSRNSMMFGMYASQLGVRENGSGLYFEDRLPALPLPEILRQGGYQTAGFGKTHWNHGRYAEEPSTRGFEYRVDGTPKGHGALYEKGCINMEEIDPEGYEWNRQECKNFGNGANVASYLGCTSQVPARQHRDGFIADQCLKYLETRVDPEKPLFLYLSFYKPHAAFNVISEFEGLYDIRDIPDVPQPPWAEEPETHLREIRKNSRALRGQYAAWKETWEKLSPMQRRMTTLRYWANCSWLDAYFGKVLDKLQETGLLVNSLIVFTSDHGDMMGERNHTFGQFNLCENSIRVPLILSGSWVPKEKQGMVDDRPAELTDLVPTLVRAAGVKPNPMLPGLDLLNNTRRTGAFSEFHCGTERQAGPAWAWRNEDWKLISYMPGLIWNAAARLQEFRGELYDLRRDPYECKNIYYDPKYATVVNQLTTEMLMGTACAYAKAPFYYSERGLAGLEPPDDNKNNEEKTEGL
ncbi:MAG TPA: sulfatase [Clostridiales bacterium]|nr:sulfatase [Clostridiales bacterium]